MKPYPNEELDRMSKREIIRLYKRTVEQFNDAVPVIRCKDCKYYQQGRSADEWLWCMMNHHYTDEEKYCAWAERKEE